MKLIILCGENEKYNRDWAKRIKFLLQDYFDEINFLEYEHWKNKKEESMNLDKELEKLTKLTKGDSNYIIFAKTAGILLALKGIYEDKLSPLKCVFLGVPIIWARLHNYNVDDWIKFYRDIPTLIIQKEEDPAMYFDDLVNYIENKEISNYSKIIKIPGNDMFYEDLDKVKEIVIDYISDDSSVGY
jgi:hypothetical protein